MLGPAVDHMRAADTPLDCLGAGEELGNHPAGDAFVRDSLAGFRGGQPMDQAGGIRRILEQAGGAGQ